MHVKESDGGRGGFLDDVDRRNRLPTGGEGWRANRGDVNCFVIEHCRNERGVRVAEFCVV